MTSCSLSQASKLLFLHFPKVPLWSLCVHATGLVLVPRRDVVAPASRRTALGGGCCLALSASVCRTDSWQVCPVSHGSVTTPPNPSGMEDPSHAHRPRGGPLAELGPGRAAVVSGRPGTVCRCLTEARVTVWPSGLPPGGQLWSQRAMEPPGILLTWPRMSLK